MTSTHRVVVHQPGEGRPIDMGAFRMTVKAESGDTAGGLSVLEADEPPGLGPPMHIHRDAGPPGVNHGFRVGASPSRKLNIYVPAAMVGYFDELAAANRLDVPLDPNAVTDIADRYQMQITGDVPKGYA